MIHAAALSLFAFGAALNPNASFEDDVTMGWASDDIEGAVWYRTENAEARTGKWVIQLRGTGLMTDTRVRLMSQPIPVQGGDAISYECWIRADGAPRKDLVIYVEGRRGDVWEPLPPISEQPQSDRWLMDQWTPRTGTAFVPAGVTVVRAVCAGPLTNEHRVTWFVDDFELQVTGVQRYLKEAMARQLERLPDIYLASPDSLSQSALGCYGNERIPTPDIDWIASEGKRWEQVTTASPWTKPSFASIMTSLYPSQHRVQDVHYALPEGASTLAEMLHARGYLTAAFVWAPYDGYLGPYMQFNQGFDIFFFSDDETLVTQALLRFLESNADNFKGMQAGGLFVWHHLWEPHTPFTNRYHAMLSNPDGKLGPVDVTDAILARSGWWGKPSQGYANEADQHFFRQVYEWEAGYTSELIGQVFRRFQWAGMLEKLNVVFCSDHGESFGERAGTYGHSHGYESCLRIPLIMRLPGKLEGGTVDAQGLVSSLDIMPTLLEVAGIQRPDYLEGRSLLQVAAPDEETAHYGISETRRHGYLTVRDARYKLVLRNAARQVNDDNLDHRWSFEDGGGVYELYDLDADPHETNNVAAALPEELQRLKGVLEAHCKRTAIGCGTAEPEDDSLPVSKAMLEQMRTLGYFGDSPQATTALPDTDVGTAKGFGNLKGL